MDLNSEPCNNFYEFACGNFTKNAKFTLGIPFINSIFSVQAKILDQLKNSIENEITDKDPETFKKIKKAYDLCMDKCKRYHILCTYCHYIFSYIYSQHFYTKFLARIDDFGKRDLIEYLKQGSSGWPLLDPSWNESTFNWTQNDAAFSSRGLFHDSLIKLTVSPDLTGQPTIKVST